MPDFMRPILRWASKRQEGFTSREVADAVADHFNFSVEARNELTRGGLSKLDSRTSWAITHLKHAGLLRRTGERSYEITEAGKEEAFSSDRRMTHGYLMRSFSSYREHRERIKNKKKQEE